MTEGECAWWCSVPCTFYWATPKFTTTIKRVLSSPPSLFFFFFLASILSPSSVFDIWLCVGAFGPCRESCSQALLEPQMHTTGVESQRFALLSSVVEYDPPPLFMNAPVLKRSRAILDCSSLLKSEMPSLCHCFWFIPLHSLEDISKQCFKRLHCCFLKACQAGLESTDQAF